ncbi:MAG: dephospho-CoA kinase [Clostridiales bacterium]|nr:dephospho-CoA kinase [Clostridiales bacterium]
MQIQLYMIQLKSDLRRENMNKIIAIVGMCGAGKSEATEFFEKRGFERVYFGAITFDEMKKRGLEPTQDNERKIREEFRASGDMAIYAKLNEEKVRKAYEKGNVVIESMYSWSEYKYIKEIFGDAFDVICIVVDRALRKERIANRPTRSLTSEEADKRDYTEIENIEKGGPISIADYYILNNGSMDELYSECEKIYNKIIK